MILKDFNGDGVGVECVTVGDEETLDGVRAAGDSERVGDFRKLIVERSVSVSPLRTFTFASNFDASILVLEFGFKGVDICGVGVLDGFVTDIFVVFGVVAIDMTAAITIELSRKAFTV